MGSVKFRNARNPRPKGAEITENDENDYKCLPEYGCFEQYQYFRLVLPDAGPVQVRCNVGGARAAPVARSAPWPDLH